MKKRILDPLHMENTYFTVGEAGQTGRLARPYRKKAVSVVEVPFLNNEAIGPAGSMISSIQDMSKWLHLHLQKGVVNGCPLLSPALLEELYCPQIVSGKPHEHMPELTPSYSALGWFVQSYRGHRMIFHAGNLQGFTSFVSFLPGMEE
ncbi:serine hydrolase domain-containing protein [Brevibacillus choshinensis]|uniref:serine hydrolase domain-containing protein n=1 Tax=Brevibacillus choshinensis TaxID=54911 RepID=UPI002E206D74|nr:serine hydrolase [Brevibacillus choshinensis]